MKATEPNWRTKAMGEPDYDLMIGLDTIKRTIEYWIEFDRAGRDKEGLETTDETYIYAPPHWPSHGVLKAWAHLFGLLMSRPTLTPQETEYVLALMGSTNVPSIIRPNPNGLSGEGANALRQRLEAYLTQTEKQSD